MIRKELTIGLFGFGCVGHGLYEVIEKTPALQASIKRICVKDPGKARPIPSEHFTFNKGDILNDASINTVVELIDDADEAFEIVKEALQKGKAVVSANKKMIAEHFEELLFLQRQYYVPLLYEGACCASIPIIRNLEEYYDNDLLESIEGIVNGSTNYILTKTVEENLSYEEALKDAQAQGYAESNPILDTGGFDAKYKLLILIAHAFGVALEPDAIFNLGIDRIGELELRYAREKGLKIKLMAHAHKNEIGKIIAFVMPRFVDKKDSLFSVDGVFNGIRTKSCFSDIQFFVGKGAGAYPTASAVLSDISALSYDYRYAYKKENQTDTLAADTEVFLKVFLRHESSHAAILKARFMDIHESYMSQDVGYTVGTLSLATLKEIASDPGLACSFVLVGPEEEKNFHSETAGLVGLGALT